MFTSTFIVYLICVLVVIILIGGRLYLDRQEKNTIKQTASALAAKADLWGRYIINKNGVKCWYRYYPGAKNSPPVLTVSVPCLSHGEFTVVPEGKFDKLSKKIGFSSELQTNDADFDNNYYILSDTVDFARVYFQAARRREEIKNLYRLGFNQVKHNGKTLEASWTGFDEFFLNSSLVNETIASLAKLSENLPDFFIGQEFLGIPRLRIKTATLYFIPSFVLAAAIVAWFSGMRYPPLDGSAVLARSLLFSIPAVILYLIIAGLTVKGRAAAHKDFLGIVFITLIAFFPFSNNMLVLLNGTRDINAPTVHNVPVINKYLTHNKSSTTCHVTVVSWRPGRITEGFTVGSNTYNRIRLNKTIARIVTKPGYLGFEWLISKQFNN